MSAARGGREAQRSLNVNEEASNRVQPQQGTLKAVTWKAGTGREEKARGRHEVMHRSQPAPDKASA